MQRTIIVRDVSNFYLSVISVDVDLGVHSLVTQPASCRADLNGGIVGSHLRYSRPFTNSALSELSENLRDIRHFYNTK